MCTIRLRKIANDDSNDRHVNANPPIGNATGGTTTEDGQHNSNAEHQFAFNCTHRSRLTHTTHHHHHHHYHRHHRHQQYQHHRLRHKAAGIDELSSLAAVNAPRSSFHTPQQLPKVNRLRCGTQTHANRVHPSRQTHAHIFVFDRDPYIFMLTH